MDTPHDEIRRGGQLTHPTSLHLAIHLVEPRPDEAYAPTGSPDRLVDRSCAVKNAAARASATSASSSMAAKPWKTWGTPGVTSRVTGTSSDAARPASRRASLRRISCEPTWIRSGGNPERSAKIGLMCGCEASAPLT